MMELVTEELRLLRLIRKFEAMGVPHGQTFWRQALDVTGIELTRLRASRVRGLW